MRDQILAKHYQNPLEVQGKRITIMKELPKEVVQKRRDYKKLTDKLRPEDIRYRWEIPESL